MLLPISGFLYTTHTKIKTVPSTTIRRHNTLFSSIIKPSKLTSIKPEFRSHSLEIDMRRTFAKPSHVSHASTPPKLKRGWDSFWKKGVKVRGNEQRRHIIRSKIMKESIQIMNRWASEHYKTTELAEVYKNITSQNELPTAPAQQAKTLNELEKAVFKKLHNMRFNIFIGDGHTNQAINDLAEIIATKESLLIEQIKQAATKKELAERIKQWLIEFIDSKKSYKYPEYTKKRLEIEKNIREVMTLSKESLQKHPLSELQIETVETLKCLFDSLATDLSNAANDDVRVWQNQNIIPLNAEFERINATPNLEAYQDLLTKFLDYEEIGCNVLLGIKLEELNNYRKNPSALKTFVSMIRETDHHYVSCTDK